MLTIGRRSIVTITRTSIETRLEILELLDTGRDTKESLGTNVIGRIEIRKDILEYRRQRAWLEPAHHIFQRYAEDAMAHFPIVALK